MKCVIRTKNYHDMYLLNLPLSQNLEQKVNRVCWFIPEVLSGVSFKNTSGIFKEGKGKVKLSLCLTKHHAIKTYRGSGGIASRIIDLGTRWR
jgi:hypothetical protein